MASVAIPRPRMKPYFEARSRMLITVNCNFTNVLIELVEMFTDDKESREYLRKKTSALYPDRSDLSGEQLSKALKLDADFFRIMQFRKDRLKRMIQCKVGHCKPVSSAPDIIAYFEDTLVGPLTSIIDDMTCTEDIIRDISTFIGKLQFARDLFKIACHAGTI